MTGYGRRALAGGAVAVLAAGLLGACGNTNATGGNRGGGAPNLTITSPSEDDTVGGTFTVKWEANVDLGEPETGRDHVHVFVDGNANDYTVVGGDSFQVSGLSPGEHTVDVTLQHADHSSAGAKDQVDVTVSGSGGTMSPSESSGGGGYNY